MNIEAERHQPIFAAYTVTSLPGLMSHTNVNDVYYDDDEERTCEGDDCFLSKEVIVILARVALGVIGAAVGVAAGCKLAGKKVPLDPLSLIFAVQAIAMTARISHLPVDYRDDFASQFEIFNVQGLAAPQFWGGWSDADGWSDDSTGARFRNHFFYVLVSFLVPIILFNVSSLVCDREKAQNAIKDLALLRRLCGDRDGDTSAVLPQDLTLPSILSE